MKILQFILKNIIFAIMSCQNNYKCRNTRTAAWYGHIDCLKFAVSNGCEWHSDTTWAAVYNGHKDCLEFAVLNGCEWDQRTTYVAAWNGHKDCLEFAVSNGYEFYPRTTYIAAANGHIDCLEYIFEYCGDIVTWENSDLEKDFDNFPQKIQKYIQSVKEEWKAGFNRPGNNIKG